MGDLEYELASLLNKYSAENDSDTTDRILAQYILDCLKAFETFETAILQRNTFYAQIVEEKGE